jgi:hypothetical protein
MIDEVIGSGLINPKDAWYVNAFMQFRFHILPLRLLIVTWPRAAHTHIGADFESDMGKNAFSSANTKRAGDRGTSMSSGRAVCDRDVSKS